MSTTIAISGKGGSGKTTISAMLVRLLVERQRGSVLAVDADPNACLGLALGVQPEKTVADVREATLGGQLAGASADRERAFEYAIHHAVAEAKGFDLLVMGQPEGPKCYCAVNNLLRRYLDQARSLLELVGLRDFLSSYPRELSGGMRQRTALVRALIHDPPVLFMDEPFGALDALTREQMRIDLESLLMSRPKTVLFITHSIDEAVLLADRVVVMSPRPGQIKTVTDVDLGSRRDVDTREDPAFFRKVTEVREALRGMQVTDLDQAVLEP